MCKQVHTKHVKLQHYEQSSSSLCWSRNCSSYSRINQYNEVNCFQQVWRMFCNLTPKYQRNMLSDVIAEWGCWLPIQSSVKHVLSLYSGTWDSEVMPWMCQWYELLHTCGRPLPHRNVTKVWYWHYTQTKDLEGHAYCVLNLSLNWKDRGILRAALGKGSQDAILAVKVT